MYFSSLVSESLTTPPSQEKLTKMTSSSSERNPKSKADITPLRMIPTRAGQQMSSTFSPPRDRIEEDFQNTRSTTSTTLHGHPIVASRQQTAPSLSLTMRPPTYVPPVVKSPSVTAVTTVTMPTHGGSRMLTRADTMPQQLESQRDAEVKFKSIVKLEIALGFARFFVNIAKI